MGVTFEALKIISDYFLRLDKDFSYLQHPQRLPRAYEKAVIEVSRRRKFRRFIDDELNRLKQHISRERDLRNAFMNEFGKLLPSEFIPQLRETTPIIKLEGGGLKDYELPEINEIEDGGDDMISGGAVSGSNGVGDP